MGGVFGIAPGGPVAVLLAAGLLSGSAWARCERYAVNGVLPGATARQVRDALGGEEFERRVERGPTGAYTTASYPTREGTVVVRYDRPVSRHGDARVDLLRRTLPSRLLDSTRLGPYLVDLYGEPTSGRDRLDSGLRDGSAVWVDVSCGLVVTAYFQKPEWWQPAAGTLFVEVQSLVSAELEASIARTFSETSPTGTQLEADAPAVPSTNGAEVASPNPLPSEPDERVAPDPARIADSNGEPERTVGTEPERIASFYVAPSYPDRARRAGVTARIVLDVLVLRNGRVGDAKVVESGPPGFGFEEAAIEAVRRWRYRPATLDGEPVDTMIRVAVSFR